MGNLLSKLLGNKAALYIGGGSLILLTIAGLYIWVLRAQAEADELVIDGLKADVVNLTATVELRNNYIARIAEEAAGREQFLKEQIDSMEEIKKDAPVDTDILGPKFFNGLRR